MNNVRSPEPAPEGERACPACGYRMLLDRTAGITMDVCEEHGVWLDKGELETIVAKVEELVGTRLRRRHRSAVKSAKKEGKRLGALYGFWAFLDPS